MSGDVEVSAKRMAAPMIALMVGKIIFLWTKIDISALSLKQVTEEMAHRMGFIASYTI